MSPSRGPDQRELVINANTRATLAALDFEKQLERVLRDLHQSQEAVQEIGCQPLRPSFGRAMNAAEQVVRGVAYWDREPADSIPLAVAK